MTPAELAIQQYLERAHDRAWGAGRYDVCSGIIAVINRLRGYTPPRPTNIRDEHERDLAEEGLAHGVSVSEINR